MRFLANSLSLSLTVLRSRLGNVIRTSNEYTSRKRSRSRAWLRFRPEAIGRVSFSPATNFDESGEIDGRFAVTRAKFVRPIRAIRYWNDSQRSMMSSPHKTVGTSVN